MTNNTRKKGGRKSLPWSGWGRESPNGAARTRMFRKCGYKCFLGTKSPGEQHPDFPICTKGTCDVNTKGIWAAYIRAKQMANSKKSNKGKENSKPKTKKYKRIEKKAKRDLEKRGIKVSK